MAAPTTDEDNFINQTMTYLKSRNIIGKYFESYIGDGMIQFFKNQPDFNVRTTSIVRAVTNPKAVEGINKKYVPEVIQGLCTMQRTLAFASTLDEFQALMKIDLTSAFKIASVPVVQLMATIVREASIFNLSDANVRAIHNRAIAISNRNQSVLTAMYQAVRGTGIAAVDGLAPENGRHNILGTARENTVKNINLEELFGAMDSDPCDDCNSVTCPAAYFVELLQFLRNNNLDGSKPEIGVLDYLFARRPDLGDLQLTCPNTTAVLPYIDLANEVMESFVVHLDEQTPGNTETTGETRLDVYNCDSNAGEILSEPQVLHPHLAPNTSASFSIHVADTGRGQLTR